MTDRLLDAQSLQQTQAIRSQGSMLPATAGPLFADLIACPAALESLASLGYSHPTYSDGYIISKPSGGPRLFWHYDWFAWEDTRSFEPEPMQLFLMYYLTDTNRQNGCLRVVPGSHRSHNPLHDSLREPHSGALGGALDMNAVEFSTRPDERDIPVQAGDLVMGDARLLHAAHANETEERRTLITLWYQPNLDSLPERMQAQMAKKVQPIPEAWPPEARAKVLPLLARYGGQAEPYGRSLYRRLNG